MLTWIILLSMDEEAEASSGECCGKALFENVGVGAVGMSRERFCFGLIRYINIYQ